MEGIAAMLFLVLFVGFSILTVVNLGKIHGFFKYLIENEPQAWKDIGESHLILNNTPRNNIKFFRFLYKNEYLNLTDKTAREKALILKRLLTTGLIIFPIMILLVLMVFTSV